MSESSQEHGHAAKIPAMMPAVWRRALLLTAVLAGPACVLFVNDDPAAIGPKCTFGDANDAGACGACLAKSCQTEINACCIAPSCRDRGTTALDSCANGASAQCVSSDLGHDLETCIAFSCGKECLGGVTDCTSGTNECSCHIDTFSPNDVKCSESTVRNSVCCADMTWPSTTSSCRCTYWGCTFTTTGSRCDCSGRSFAGSSSDYKDGCFPPTGSTDYHCCRNTSGSCACSKSACLNSENEVPDCSLMNADCGSYAKKVSACVP